MVYRESSEMIRMLAAAGGVLAGLAMVFAAAALYCRRRKKREAAKGCAMRMFFLMIAALPVFIVPLLAYASDVGTGAGRAGKTGRESTEASEEISGSGSGTETGTETEGETEDRTETENEDRTETETEYRTETETETGAETETESETETERETEDPSPDEEEIAGILKQCEWVFLDEKGNTLRSADGVLQTGGRLSRADHVHLQIRIKSPDAGKVTGANNLVLVQAFGGPETWRKKVQDSFRKEENWEIRKEEAVWEIPFAQDGNYLLQIGVSRGEKKVPLICSEKSIIIDTAPPEAVIGDWQGDGLYSRKDCRILVRVTDANPDEKTMPETAADGLSARFTGWEKEEKGLTGEIALSGEGSASISFTARDLAGNQSAPCRPGKVVIDKTAPQIRIGEPEGNPAGGVIYVSSAQEIIVSAADSYFDASESGVSVNIDGGGSWHIGGWQQEDGLWKMHVYLEGDGRYRVYARGRDLAGNESEYISAREISVDSTPPQIRFSGAADGASYRSPLHLTVNAEDGSLSAGALHIRLLDQLSGQETEKTLSAGGDTVSWEQEIRKDGIYILQASAEDGAGNVREEELRFRINAAGSVIEPDENTAGILLSGFMTEPAPMVFMEKNIDRLQERRLVLGGSRVRLLKEGKDYSVREITGENGIYLYRYEISAQCFSEEGYYTLHIYSKDAAGNEYAGSRSEALLCFAADYHIPEISVTGLEDGAVYRKEAPSFTIFVSDAVGMRSLRVTVNGRVILERGAQEIRAAGGVFTLQLETSPYVQEVRIEAADAAGRRALPRVMQVLVPEEEAGPAEKEEAFPEKAEKESTAARQETEVYRVADVFSDAAGGLEEKVTKSGKRRLLTAAGIAAAGIGLLAAAAVYKIRSKKEDGTE